MHQQPVASLNLDMCTSIDPHFIAQQGECQGIADADEALVHRRLSFREFCKRWKWDRVFPSLRPKPSALKCVNVKEVNYINMVQRPLQAREEARALDLKFALTQFGARAAQPVVRPCIVVGEGAIALNKPNRHCSSLPGWTANQQATYATSHPPVRRSSILLATSSHTDASSSISFLMTGSSVCSASCRYLAAWSRR